MKDVRLSQIRALTLEALGLASEINNVRLSKNDSATLEDLRQSLRTAYCHAADLQTPADTEEMAS